VSDHTAGGVGPRSAIAGDTGPVSFSGTDSTHTLPTAKANPSDPTGMLVLQGAPQWQQSTAQLTGKTSGHVCVAVNVYADATESTPKDGQQLIGNSLDPNCDRRYGQRNVQIVAAPVEHRVQFPIMVLVPATDRCPLDALVRIRRAELDEDQDGALRRVHELDQAATTHAITRLCRPDRDPLGHIKIGHEGSSGGNQRRLPLGASRARGPHSDGRPSKGQKPGDAYAFDILTTDTATDLLYGCRTSVRAGHWLKRYRSCTTGPGAPVTDGPAVAAA
jgi:hypothetical protein